MERNSLGETTSARIRKGLTGEEVVRHATSLIILIPGENCVEGPGKELRGPAADEQESIVPRDVGKNRPPPRLAATEARKRFQNHLE